MSTRTRVVATVAAALLVLASVGAVGAKTLTVMPSFSVFYGGTTAEGDQVVVTRQLSWKGNNSPDDVCVKNVDPDHCDGGYHDYSRLYAGAPWVIDDIP